MDHNPYNLKKLDKKPSDYLDADEFINFLKKKNIPVKRKDNLPRFANGNGIQMIRIKRVGKGGSTPAAYKIPSEKKNLRDITKHEGKQQFCVGERDT